MRVAILGAAGMLGRKLADRLAERREMRGRAIESFVLHDIVPPPAPPCDAAVETLASDLSEPGAAAAVVASRPDIVFHLAAVVSGEAEADLDKGYRVNLDGTRALLEAIRAVGDGYRPRLVFSSSIAVFGSPLPDIIPDDFVLRPRTSYGTQKAMGELLVADYSRRGFVDGISIRLPTICVRPGRPNRAASSFYSGIIREPLKGEPADLPVPTSMRHWFASPRAAIGFLVHAAGIDTAPLESRSLTMPGISASVAEMIDSLRRAGGDAAAALVRSRPDPAIAAIVETWPRAFDAAAALRLGFEADRDFDRIVAIHLEDDAG